MFYLILFTTLRMYLSDNELFVYVFTTDFIGKTNKM